MEKFEELRLSVYHQLGEGMKEHIKAYSFAYELPDNPYDKDIETKREKAIEAKVNAWVEDTAKKVYEIIYNRVTYSLAEWMYYSQLGKIYH